MWKQGQEAKCAIIVVAGHFVYDEKHQQGYSAFGMGTLLSDLDAILYDTPCTTTLHAVEKSQMFVISKRDLICFFKRFPGMMLAFLGSYAVE